MMPGTPIPYCPKEVAMSLPIWNPEDEDRAGLAAWDTVGAYNPSGEERSCSFDAFNREYDELKAIFSKMPANTIEFFVMRD